MKTVDVWSGTEGSGTWRFNQSSGLVRVVPEPSTYALLALGLSTVLIFRKRSRSIK